MLLAADGAKNDPHYQERKKLNLKAIK